MTPRPLVLTDQQHEIIRAQAKKLKLGWHSRFRELVADRLLALDEIDDDAVRFAAEATVQRIRGGR